MSKQANLVPPTDAADDQAAERTQTRRGVLGAAAGAAVAAGAAGTLAAPALAKRSSSADKVLSFIATQEGFGVTFLSEAVRRAPGTPSEKFAPVLQSADTAEFDHLRALERLGHKSQVDRYWIPDAFFGVGGPEVFQAIQTVETIEVSMYLVGVTAFTEKQDEKRSRLCAEALGVEAEHRTLARAALMMLGVTTEAPNNVGFNSFAQRDVAAVRSALEHIGIGYGKQGATPGRFYDYPGDPLKTGAGLPLISNKPQ